MPDFILHQFIIMLEYFRKNREKKFLEQSRKNIDIKKILLGLLGHPDIL
jgi:hypothetical protein